MNKFEQVGVEYQYSAVTKEQAIRSFRYSCRCCSTKGMRLDCDRCAIACTHDMIVAIFDDKEEKRHGND